MTNKENAIVQIKRLSCCKEKEHISKTHLQDLEETFRKLFGILQ